MRFPGKVNCQGCLSVLLTLAITWEVAAPAWKKIRFFCDSGVTSYDGCSLDSFSEPAIALAVLRTEADRLFNSYAEKRDRNTYAQAALVARSVAQPGADVRSSDKTSSLVKLDKQAGAPEVNAQPLEHLRKEIQELKTDVGRKLLAIYSERGLWAEFLDHYLELLREAPENPWVVNWAPCALVHSQDCGRTGEVVHALKRAILGNPNPKAVFELKSALEQWGPADSSRVEAGLGPNDPAKL